MSSEDVVAYYRTVIRPVAGYACASKSLAECSSSGQVLAAVCMDCMYKTVNLL